MRINFVGGPGSGKTFNMHRTIVNLKAMGKDIEPVSEYAKAWVIEGRRIAPFDQVYFFGKQLEYEYRNLKHGIPGIITDSALFTGIAHCLKYDAESLVPHLWGLLREFDAQFPYLTIYVERGKSYAYQQAGRFQSEAEAKGFDTEILRWMREYYGPDAFHIINSEDERGMMELILRHLP